jgi:tetratricopeptide (TPR) repeat protein
LTITISRVTNHAGYRSIEGFRPEHQALAGREPFRRDAGNANEDGSFARPRHLARGYDAIELVWLLRRYVSIMDQSNPRSTAVLSRAVSTLDAGFRRDAENRSRSVTMSSLSPPEVEQRRSEQPLKARTASSDTSPDRPSWLTKIADAALIALFLFLTALLGAFPLKDADIYWHLRTGDLIRQTGAVPRYDIFTFTRAGAPWIDLHWIFQIAISCVHEHGGVVGLNLAKCGVTCVAMLLLVTARRREWPVWVIVLSWLPALMVLGGRMYVRPETLSLLYLSIFLAVILRWDRYPRLALVLPLVQVAWVNTQGLFVFGPVILIFGLVDAALRRGIFGLEQRKWWRTILVASLATGAACFVNPYGPRGALYPLELAGTMSNPIFSLAVAELTPIPEFINRATLWNLPLQLHFITMILGALSFVVPLVWKLSVWLAGGRAPAQDTGVDRSPGLTTGGKKRSRSKRAATKAVDRPLTAGPAVHEALEWRVNTFRLLLYAAFSMLSLQATRNSHQFAAVVGTVTAWNFGDWAAALARRRSVRAGASALSRATAQRLMAFAAVALLLLWVGSGRFYKMTGEGRAIGLGEEPLFFAHAAAQFAGEPGMPERFLSFHNGHAALFEYYHGPERKVYTDPRLEVAGAELFGRYIQLERRIKKDEPGWEAELNEMGRPVILIDHENNWAIGATLLRSVHWRCVGFDAIAAVFVHDSAASVVEHHAVDFAARHFRPDASMLSRPVPELIASAKAFRKYANAASGPGGSLGRPLVWLGLDDARRILATAPDSAEAWKNLGLLEQFREPAGEPAPRFRAVFDPVFDLSIVRATYALLRATELAPSDFLTLMSLHLAYKSRLMHEAALPLLDRIEALYPTNQLQSREQAEIAAARAEYERLLGATPSTTWRNLSELDQIVTAQLASGRAGSAAALLERTNPPDRASWEVANRMATLRLHLGEPARARELWRKAGSASEPAIRDARIATTYLVECDFDAARRYYQQSLGEKPDLFEANYGLAVLEQDAGNAAAALDAARKAIATAPHAAARAAARVIAAGVRPFVPISTDGEATRNRY